MHTHVSEHWHEGTKNHAHSDTADCTNPGGVSFSHGDAQIVSNIFDLNLLVQSENPSVAQDYLNDSRNSADGQSLLSQKWIFFDRMSV
jgi:hypothetical protein